jgi:hypothetical protein
MQQSFQASRKKERRQTTVWEWQVWRCFDDIEETSEEKGWEFRFPSREGNEIRPQLAGSDRVLR